MNKFFTDNKRYLELLIITILIIGLFASLLVRWGVVLGFIGGLVDVLKPFIYGFVIAYLMKPTVDFFQKYIKKLMTGAFNREAGSYRGVSVICAFIVLIGLIILLVAAIIPGLVTSIKAIVDQLPDSADKLEKWLKGILGYKGNDLFQSLSELLDKTSDGIIDSIKDHLLPSLENIAPKVTAGFGGVLTVLKNVGLGCIVAVYMLLTWEKFGAQAKILLYSLVPKKGSDWIVGELKLADRLFGGFISGKVLDSAIIGVICFIGMVILQMPYAMLISVIVGVTNIIPFFGPYIGAIPSAILVLVDSPAKCIIFVIFIVLLQQLDGNVIGPRILGSKVGVSSFWILFAILFFGSYWGILGMIVGVPIFGLLYDLVIRIMHWGLEKHGQTELLEEYKKDYPGKTAKKKEKKSGGEQET